MSKFRYQRSIRLIMRKELLLLIFVLLTSNELNGQSFIHRYINSIINDTTDISQPQLLYYPTLAYTPETSWEIGVSALYVYYARRDTTNRLSEINSFTFATLEGQYGLWLDHALYTHNNDWFFLGRFRVQHFPLLYYGIGMGSPEQYLARVDANQLLLKERFLRQLAPNLFFGLELDFQRISSVDFVASDAPPETDWELPLGHEGSTAFGVGLGAVYDSRHNVLNVRKGEFAELAYIYYPGSWSTFDMAQLLLDARIFRTVRPHQVLAAQVLGEFNFGDVPFNQMALLGGESIMRGYYTGRYRDRHQLAAQLEYRFLPLPLGFTKRFGAAVFAGAGQVFPDFSQAGIHKVVWSTGAGLRFLLFPKKDIYTRLDLAFTAEGTGFYFFIGEAF